MNRDPQRAVREGQLNRTLEQFYAEVLTDVGERSKKLLYEYHTKVLEPRLEWLETPWWRKPFKKWRRWWDLRRAVEAPIATAEPEPATTEPEPEPRIVPPPGLIVLP